MTHPTPVVLLKKMGAKHVIKKRLAASLVRGIKGRHVSELLAVDV